mgnify:CR=1 FL=1
MSDPWTPEMEDRFGEGINPLNAAYNRWVEAVDAEVDNVKTLYRMEVDLCLHELIGRPPRAWQVQSYHQAAGTHLQLRKRGEETFQDLREKFSELHRQLAGRDLIPQEVTEKP